MASIVYKSLSSLQPIELKYQYFKDEEFKNTKTSYKNGYTVFQTPGLQNYQDTAINRGSSFILTSAVNLDQILTSSQNYNIGKLPGTFYIQPENFSIYFGCYSSETNTITLSTVPTPIYLSPIPNTNEVELIVAGRYVQVEEDYPFKVITSSKSLPLVSIHRQRFECVYNNFTITFKTKTKDGPRYLAFNNDWTMRATGLMFNNSIVSPYVFRCIPITLTEMNINSELKNSWVTYSLSFEQDQDNKTVAINKEFTLPTNLLIDFSVEKAVSTGRANINIANLKTGVTPFGGPAPVSNV